MPASCQGISVLEGANFARARQRERGIIRWLVGVNARPERHLDRRHLQSRWHRDRRPPQRIGLVLVRMGRRVPGAEGEVEDIGRPHPVAGRLAAEHQLAAPFLPRGGTLGGNQDP